MFATPKQLIKVGVGLRHPHYTDALNTLASIDFVEVHAENFFAQGGATQALLTALSEHYPVSIHGTALGLASLQPIPSHYLQQLKQLYQRVQPMLVSDHLAQAWFTKNHQVIHAGDLLAIAFDERTLAQTIRNIAQTQETLGRQILVENIASYVNFSTSTWQESQFFAEIIARTGCGLLLDINNLTVNALNNGVEDTQGYIKKWLADIPATAIGEIHLAGYSQPIDNTPIIDDHSQPVSNAVWSAYAQVLAHTGAVPTLIEWDTNLPTWSVLLAEVDKARAIAAEVLVHD